MADLVLCSVPAHDLEWTRQAFPHAAVETAPFDEGLVARHPDARVVAVMIFDPVPVELLERLPRLEAVITRSDGFDHLPLAWMEPHGVAGYHLEGYATDSVAQLTLMMLVALARRVPEGLAQTRGVPPAWDRSRLVGRHLPELTVGVLGTGRIGARVVRLLDAWGVRCVGHDLRPDPALKELSSFRYAGSFEALLEQSGALTLHVPLDASTRFLVDEAALRRLPRGALLVNNARGAVVDPAAVAAALRSGHLGGFAADTLPQEPAVPDLSRFQGLPNVLLTPHLGAHNRSTIQERYRITARIAEAVLENRPADVELYRVRPGGVA